MSQKKLIVIAGPTAVGKTAVAIALAQALSTDVVSADSRQLFREMNIGTAKPTPEERALVRHHFVDTHSVNDDYDAAQYAEEALERIHTLFTAHDYVILCGGSGLYIKGVCDGFDDMPEIPAEVRAQLMARYRLEGIGWLQEQMRIVDPAAFDVIDKRNPHRLVRALEVHIHTGRSILSYRTKQKRVHSFEIVKIGLDLPRKELYRRIDVRMDKMIAEGLFQEAEALYPLRHRNPLQTVGYQEIFGYMDNVYDLDECIRLLKRNSRRYAKRQLTWFKKDEQFRWFSPDDLPGMMEYVTA